MKLHAYANEDGLENNNQSAHFINRAGRRTISMDSQSRPSPDQMGFLGRPQNHQGFIAWASPIGNTGRFLNWFDSKAAVRVSGAAETVDYFG